jgi:hypothetical protein
MRVIQYALEGNFPIRGVLVLRALRLMAVNLSRPLLSHMV